MKEYSTICLDLDGTVYKGKDPIPEAVDFIHRMKEKGKQPYYITNNASSTPKQVAQKLANFGIQVDASFILTSALATVYYCKQNHQGKTIQLIGECGLIEAFEQAGFTIVEEQGEVVVIGIDRAITYDKLSRACLAIRAGAVFIATNGDRAIPTEKGLEPGNGSLVQLVSYSTGKEPFFIGKPEPYLLELAQKQAGVTKEEMVMIGDNYETDILFGLRFGIDTIHVAGGVTSPEIVRDKEWQPTRLMNNLSEWQ